MRSPSHIQVQVFCMAFHIKRVWWWLNWKDETSSLKFCKLHCAWQRFAICILNWRTMGMFNLKIRTQILNLQRCISYFEYNVLISRIMHSNKYVYAHSHVHARLFYASLHMHHLITRTETPVTYMSHTQTTGKLQVETHMYCILSSCFSSLCLQLIQYT